VLVTSADGGLWRGHDTSTRDRDFGLGSVDMLAASAERRPPRRLSSLAMDGLRSEVDLAPNV
jgi:hypothetical protein